MPNPWGEILLNKTPHPWIVRALDSLDVLLLDHAHCEKKAAMTALSLIHRYPERDLSKQLSPLAREELLHFANSIKNAQKPETDGESAAQALSIALKIQKIIDQ